MNRTRSLSVLIASVALMVFACPVLAGSNKSLVIALDGVRADGLITASTPNVDRLINGTFGGGAYSGAYAFYGQTAQDASTVSVYMHPCMMTGVSYTTLGGDYTTYPHYLTTIENNNSALNSAYLFTWSWDINIPCGADYIKDSTDAGNTTRAVNMINGTHSDASGDLGTSWATGTDVDAMFIFFDDPDIAGHTYGYSPLSSGYLAGIQTVDGRIGQILTAVENRPNFATENWQIVVTSDHGGEGTTHGPNTPNCETVPFLVAGKSAQQGQLSGTPMHYDTAPTAVKHVIGAGSMPTNYDGQPQGDSVQPKAASIIDGLVLYLGFESNYNDGSGRGNHASVGPNSDHDPTLHAAGGKFGGYVEINNFGGGTSNSSYLTLGQPSDLDFGTGTSFTIAGWYRAQAAQSGDPVIIGNKNWVSGMNTGTLVLADEGDGDDFGLNISDGSKRRDIEPVDYDFNQWYFVAATVDRTGSGTLYVGTPTGAMWVISDFASDLGDINSLLPWNIGQDGTGEYPYNLDADLDDIAIWQRVLALDELKLLHNGGAGVELGPLIPEPATMGLLALAVPALLRRRKRV